ncbi:MAG: HipA N-terminal domain-containing protein [Bacteroidales bacterium]|nr:HipA N-terminal domain-containing protein [Bacteroidales bacterium]
MRKAKVYRNSHLAGELIQENAKSYVFRYSDSYFSNDSLPAISLTLPKTQQEYKSEFLFPFFFNMLSEGVNRKLQSRQLKIDEKDYFGLLLETAKYDTIGAITLKPDTE